MTAVLSHRGTAVAAVLSHRGTIGFVVPLRLFSFSLKIISGPWQQNLASWRPAPRPELRAELRMQNYVQI